MRVEGKFTLPGRPDDVWKSLLDVEALASCLPGFEGLEPAENGRYRFVVAQKVGPIHVRCCADVTVIEASRPTHLRVIGSGVAAGGVGQFKLDSDVHLAETSSSHVEVAYVATISLTGTLASFGDRVLRPTIAKAGEQFTSNLKAKLAPPER